MEQKLKELLTNEIKNTKSLSSLDYDYVYKKLEKHILTFGNNFKKLKIIANNKGLEKIEKNKIFKIIVKEVRDELRIVYGSFLTNDFFKKEKYESIEELFKCHKSTNERIEFYNEIYEKIFLWHKPTGISDLACGLNPLSYKIIEEKLKYSPKYFASDLSNENMDFLNNYFKKNKINGIAKSYDLTTLEITNNKDLKQTDTVFLFKALDSLETVKKDISKELLQLLPQKYIIVSFPTKSLISKIEFKREKRNWFYNFLNKMNWKYEEFEVENEMFILINKININEK